MNSTYNLIWRRFHVTIVSMEKHKIFNILSEYVGLFTEHAKRMRRIILLLCPVMKIGPVGAELFHPDGRTDGRTERQT